MVKGIFTSRVSFEDAQQKALAAGYRPTGQSINKHNQFVVFAVLDQGQAQAQVVPGQRSPFDGSWLRGKI